MGRLARIPPIVEVLIYTYFKCRTTFVTLNNLLQNSHSLDKMEDNVCVLNNCKKGNVINAWE